MTDQKDDKPDDHVAQRKDTACDDDMVLIKSDVHRLSNELQLVISYIETEEYVKAYNAVQLAVKTLRRIATKLVKYGR